MLILFGDNVYITECFDNIGKVFVHCHVSDS